MINLYTIGFAGKSAEKFFSLLQQAGVSRIIDTRLNNVSQMSGFAKATDLKFFAKVIGNIDYIHRLDFAPTKELLDQYRQKHLTWVEYEVAYLNLLKRRGIAQKIDIEMLENSCLLCSEHSPGYCHRRLLADYLCRVKGGIDVYHLVD